MCVLCAVDPKTGKVILRRYKSSMVNLDSYFMFFDSLILVQVFLLKVSKNADTCLGALSLVVDGYFYFLCKCLRHIFSYNSCADLLHFSIFCCIFCVT